MLAVLVLLKCHLRKVMEDMPHLLGKRINDAQIPSGTHSRMSGDDSDIGFSAGADRWQG